VVQIFNKFHLTMVAFYRKFKKANKYNYLIALKKLNRDQVAYPSTTL
jgi:hypothetical protein